MNKDLDGAAPPAYDAAPSLSPPPYYETNSNYNNMNSLYAPPSAAVAQNPPQRQDYAPATAYPSALPSQPTTPPSYYDPTNPQLQQQQPIPQPLPDPTPVVFQRLESLSIISPAPIPTPAVSSSSSSTPFKSTDHTHIEGLIPANILNFLVCVALGVATFVLILTLEMHGPCEEHKVKILAMFFPAIVLVVYGLFALAYSFFSCCPCSRSDESAKTVWTAVTGIFAVLALISGGLSFGMLFSIDKCWKEDDNTRFFLGLIIIFSILLAIGVCSIIGLLIAQNSYSENGHFQIFLFQLICLVLAILALVCVFLLTGGGKRSRRR